MLERGDMAGSRNPLMKPVYYDGERSLFGTTRLLALNYDAAKDRSGPSLPDCGGIS